MICDARKKGFYSRVSEESGTAVFVESTLIYPLVFIILFFMMAMSFLFMQKTILQADAEKAADYIAKSMDFEGYSEVVAFGSDGSELEDQLSKDEIEKLISDENVYNFLEEPVEVDYYEKQLEEIIESHSVFQFCKLDCSIEITESVMNNSVKVSITNTVNLPSIFSSSGLNDRFSYEVSSVATYGSPSEFIADVDFVRDLPEQFDGQVFADKIVSIITAIGMQ